jgi:hypothetical protein
LKVWETQRASIRLALPSMACDVGRTTHAWALALCDVDLRPRRSTWAASETTQRGHAFEHSAAGSTVVDRPATSYVGHGRQRVGKAVELCARHPVVRVRYDSDDDVCRKLAAGALQFSSKDLRQAIIVRHASVLIRRKKRAGSFLSDALTAKNRGMWCWMASGLSKT